MRHNKKRNTALLYEFLIRHVSRCLVESKNDEATKALAIVKKYFKSGPLREDLSLFDCVLNSKVKTAEYAARVITETVKQSKLNDFKKLDKAKSSLIREINKTFNADKFYSYKIPNYIVYASLQSLFNNESGHKVFSESIEKIRLEERIATFLLIERDKKKTLTEALKLDPQYNNAVYRIVINKFNEKYSDSLNESQKKLLTKYAVSLVSENKKVFSNAMEKELQSIKQNLTFIRDPEIAKDKDLLKKISECRVIANSLDVNDTSDANIVKILRFMSLSQEVTA